VLGNRFSEYQLAAIEQTFLADWEGENLLPPIDTVARHPLWPSSSSPRLANPTRMVHPRHHTAGSSTSSGPPAADPLQYTQVIPALSGPLGALVPARNIDPAPAVIRSPA